MFKNEEDIWDATWAVISLVLAQATAFITVYPVFNEGPMASRVGMTLGFGMLLTATYFLMGVPCVAALRHGFTLMRRQFNAHRKNRTEKS